MPAIGNAIGIPFRRGGVLYSSYWPAQPEVLFFGLYSEISGGQMPNRVTGATDFLIVAGVAGSETYQAPDTVTYQTADTDYIWFKTDTTQRTTTTAELIGYDFTRTIVKYANTAPYAIEAIMILSSDVDTAKMRNDFDLSVWWSNVLSAYGNVKGNRESGQSVWTAESVLEAEYLAVYNALTTKPSETIRDAQNTFVKALVDGGQWAKLDRLFMFAQTVNSADEALLDWIDPTRKAILIGSPNFTALEGFTGNGIDSGINSKYNPTDDGIKYIQDSASAFAYNRANKAPDAGIFIGVGPDTLSTEIGLYTRYTNGNMLHLINSGPPDVWTQFANSDARGLYVSTRLNNDIKLYKNKSANNATVNSTRIPTFDICFLCANQVDEITFADHYYQFSIDQISLGGFGENLTQADVNAITDAFEVYMDSNGKGVIA